MGYATELTEVPRPVRMQTNPPHYDWLKASYRASEYVGSDDLLRMVRSDLADGKMHGFLPKNLRTLVSLNRRYGTKLSLTIRGLTANDICEPVPVELKSIGQIPDTVTVDAYEDGRGLNRNWAFVFLQAYLIADGYNIRSDQQGDDYGSRRYTCDLYVQNVGSFSEEDLISIVDAE